MKLLNSKAILGTALAAVLVMAVAAPAKADDREWRDHVRHVRVWRGPHPHPVMVAPAPVVYAPPAVVYAPPPPPPSAGINLIIPLNIR